MPDESLLLGQLADEFTGRVRSGDLPAIDEYTRRHPELAERIRTLFPTLMMLEGLAGSGGKRAAGDPGKAGDTFGPYRLVRELGRGGMGVVYEAIHQSLHKRVALKLLAVSGTRTGVTLERFLREARTAAELHHTNIVPVFDIGQVGGAPYYAMQFIEGRGLDRLLGAVQASATTLSVYAANALQPANGDTVVEPQHAKPALPGNRLAPRKVAEIGIQAADALAYAHERGVVHRDIKPSNLLLDEQGVVWITDFGLARRQDDVALTHSNTLLGTPRYMSPEQASAAKETIDHRTDIYSLGVTLYEILTGRPAFDGPTALDVVQQIIERTPASPGSIDPSIPRDLETIVLKAMAKRREDRYATAAELGDDLRRFRDDRPVRARRIGPVGRLVRWAKREPRVAALTGAVFTLLVALASSAWLAVLAIQKQKERADTARSESQQALASSLLDQARVVMTSDRPGRRWQALDLVRESSALGCRLPSASDLRSVAIDALYIQDVRIHRELPGITATMSANGRTAARAVYATGDNVRIVVTDLDSGEEREIARQPIGETVPVLGLSADGQKLAVANGIGPAAVTIWDIPSGKSRKLAEPPNRADESAGILCYCVTFSPDGRRLAAVRMIDVPNVELFTWNLDSDSAPSVRDLAAKTFLPIAFANDNKLAWRSDRGLALLHPDGKTSEWTFAPDLAGGWKSSPIAFCRSKPIVATVHLPRGGAQVIVFSDVNSRSELGRLTIPGSISNIAFSPDGERLAVVVIKGSEGEVLYVRTSDRTIDLRHRAPQFGFLGRTLAWHADGQRLVSTVETQGLWLWEPTWERAGETLASGHTEATEIVFSPDSRWMAVGGWSGGKVGGGYKLRLIDRTTGRERVLDAPDTHYRLVFRGGTQLACVAAKSAIVWDCESGSEIVRRSPPDGAWESAAFDSAGALLLAEGQPGQQAACWSMSSPECQWRLPVEAGSVRLSPDGRRLIGGVGETTAKAALWDAATRQKSATLEHNPEVEESFDQPRFNPDGSRFVSLAPYVEFDRQSKAWVSLWSATTGRKLFDLSCEVYASCSAWSADGQWLAIGYEDGSVRMFDPDTGAMIFRWKPHGKRALRLAFTPESNALYSVEDGGSTIAILKLDVVRRELSKLGLGW